MNNLWSICLVFFFLSLSHCRAQKLHEVLPWVSDLPKEIELGMQLESLLEKAPPLSSMADLTGSESQEKESPDGMYFEGKSQRNAGESVLYGIKDGHLTQFYWSSTIDVSPGAVARIRSRLLEKYGTPRQGYKARLTKDGIGKITTEVYSVNDDKIVSLSSSLGETEIAVLDNSSSEVEIDELYFSYDKQKKRLQEQILRMTDKLPEEENPEDLKDVLAEVQSGTDQIRNKNFRPVYPSKEQVSKQAEQGLSNSAQKASKQREKPRSSQWFYWILGVLLLVGAALVVRNSRKNSSAR